MSLYPSNVFQTFEHPAPMQSIFEDFDTLFSETLFHPFHDLQVSHRPTGKRRGPHHRHYSTAIRLSDFRADQVAVKVEDRKVRVHAKREEGEDVAEVRKTVQLPEDVDVEKVETRFTKEGFLVIRAPYVHREKQVSAVGGAAGSELADCDSWQQMRQLLRGPGIMDLRQHIVKDDAGNTRFQIPVPVRDFHPEEISVKQIGDTVVVRAEHKEEREGQLVHRSMQREFRLPQGVDKEQLVSRITQQGLLMIEAPAPGLAAPETKDIPVVEVQQQQQQQQE